jgi:hypothetical protein
MLITHEHTFTPSTLFGAMGMYMDHLVYYIACLALLVLYRITLN